MAYVTGHSEDIGFVEYTAERYGDGYSITAYQAESGITAKYRGKGAVWLILSRGNKPAVISDGRVIWRLACIAAALEESER